MQWSLGGEGTLGQAMSGFREARGAAAERLAETLHDAHRRTTFTNGKAVVDAWVRYHDAAGYMLLGDPVMRLAVGDGGRAPR